ncbi:MAG: InlB B-repeat-containing protein [Oscillospiraceae bacterium]|nr:InlB B-repeat-containing protein [Oscillospiraceae bacterium]
MVTSLFGGLSITAFATGEHWTDGVTSDTSATYSGGAGTLESPFILVTAQDLAQLSVNVAPSSTYSSGKYFRLDADINLSGKLWTPIAANPNGYQNAFNSNFNGNGHVISNITVDDSEDETKYHMVGFFGWAYNTVIYDLGLENVSIVSSGTDSDTYAGTFVGFADDTTVTDCYATGFVNGTGEARAGEFVGQLYNDTIGNCFFSGSVASTGSMVGGFVASRRGTIQNCWCASSTAGAGFEASSSGSGTITNCYYDKTLNPSGTDSAGHWVGKTTEELKSADMIETLNGTQTPASWKRDVFGQVNAGYPVLSWVDIPPVLTRTAVTFNMNSGASPAESILYIASGSSNFYDAATGGSEQTLTEPARPSYTFGGWYKEANCTNQIIDASLALCASTDYTDASANWTKTDPVILYAKWLEETPSGLCFDYENEMITGLTANAAYALEGSAVTANADGKTAIQSSWFGNNISIVKKGVSADSSFDSAAAALTVPARPSAPTGLAAVDETYPNAGDGKITSVDETMAYKVSTACIPDIALLCFVQIRLAFSGMRRAAGLLQQLRRFFFCVGTGHRPFVCFMTYRKTITSCCFNFLPATRHTPSCPGALCDIHSVCFSVGALASLPRVFVRFSRRVLTLTVGIQLSKNCNREIIRLIYYYLSGIM